MQNYWTSVSGNSESTDHDVGHARWLDRTLKVVFSATLESVDRENSRLFKDSIVEEVNKLKELPGKDMIILGSPSLSKTFMQLNLIDEYKLTIIPIILGSNKLLFEENSHPRHLQLTESKTFESGVIYVAYKSDKEAIKKTL